MPYERLTDRARKVMMLANQEAQRFNSEYVDTEHLLLGLVKDGTGIAANVLINLDIDLRKVRHEVEKIAPYNPDAMTIPSRLPQSPEVKRVMDYAVEVSNNLNHHYLGTEHILLGLLHEPVGIAAQVLMSLGLQLEAVSREVLTLLGHEDNKTTDNTNKIKTARNMLFAVLRARFNVPKRIERTVFAISDATALEKLAEHAASCSSLEEFTTALADDGETNDDVDMKQSRMAKKQRERATQKKMVCSFCNRSNRDVGALVEGFGDVYICGECVETCRHILKQEIRQGNSNVKGIGEEADEPLDPKTAQEIQMSLLAASKAIKEALQKLDR